ncbi:hypothetical protein F7725_001352, partial [Dissostichus mawsoni]
MQQEEEEQRVALWDMCAAGRSLIKSCIMGHVRMVFWTEVCLSASPDPEPKRGETKDRSFSGNRRCQTLNVFVISSDVCPPPCDSSSSFKYSNSSQLFTLEFW